MGEICLQPGDNSGFQKIYVASNLEISYDASHQIIYCNWIGYQSHNIILQSGAVILEHTKQKGVSKILNDNRQVIGSWWDAAVWAGDVWFPEMIRAGLKHFAWILSENIFTELSARRAMEPHQDVVKTFRSYEPALKWLLDMPS